jgi:hypothetical protein
MQTLAFFGGFRPEKDEMLKPTGNDYGPVTV